MKLLSSNLEPQTSNNLYMDTGLLHLHNLLRWVILILLLVSIVKAYSGWQQKKVFFAGRQKNMAFYDDRRPYHLALGIVPVALGKIWHAENRAA